MKLLINTDPALYDQELTLKLSPLNDMYPAKIYQGDKQLILRKISESDYLININPVESDLYIWFKALTNHLLILLKDFSENDQNFNKKNINDLIFLLSS